MNPSRLLLAAWLCMPILATAQDCDPTVPPTGLSALYTPGIGVQLSWTPVPSSVGVQISASTPSGASVTRRLIGPALDQYLIPDAFLAEGTYTWRLQAACSTTPPYATTPVSASDAFTVGTPSVCPATLADVDGNVYPVSEIAGACVTAENLATRHFRDGSAIPLLRTEGAWDAQAGPAACFVDGDSANTPTYGLLYNWGAVDDPAGLCPMGWHVPSQLEWLAVVNGLGGTTVAGGAMKATGDLSAGTGLWLAPNAGATDDSGFSGLPAGYRYGYGGYASNVNGYGYWWSASEHSAFQAFVLELTYSGPEVLQFSQFKAQGISVRCFRD